MPPRRNSTKKRSPHRLEVSEDQNVQGAEIDYLPLSPQAVLSQKLEYKGWGTIESDPVGNLKLRGILI
jgi:hypothetical protein